MTNANTNIDVLILTIVRVEFTAVAKYLKNVKKIASETGTLYRVGEYNNHKVVLRRVRDQGNAVMSSEVEEAIHLFRPKVVFLVGIAGGIKKVKLGDVVVVTRTYSYESGKESDAGFLFRNKGHATEHRLLERAKDASMDHDWMTLIPNSDKKYKIIDGAIASGEKVITTSKTKLYNIINTYCEDAIAVEMEGLGFSTVLHKFPYISGINIRGISDMIDGKDEIYNDGYRELAAEHAAVFTFYLLGEIGDIISEEILFYKNNKPNKRDMTNIIDGMDTTLKQLNENLKNQAENSNNTQSISVRGDSNQIIQAGGNVSQINCSGKNNNQLVNKTIETLQQVREHISKNNIETAFEQLSKLESHRYENELISLEREYRDIMKYTRINTLSLDDTLRSINSITNNLLNAISMIEKDS